MTTTLEMVACWVSAAMGKVWPSDKVNVLERVNDIRELIYDIGASITWNTPLCVPIRSFCGECNDGCYNGIALPNFAGQVLGIYDDRRLPVQIVDRWGIYPYDEETLGRCPAYRYVDLGDDYPFLNDPPCGECYKLSLLAKSKQDAGKIVTIRFLDANDIERTEELKLGNLPVVSNHSIKAIARSGVSLPITLVGAVSAKAGTTKLAEWQPWETVPGYRRLKLEGGYCRPCHTVVAHIERRRARLHSLADPVETAQKLLWEDGARYLTLHNKANADAADQVNEARYLASFRVKLEEEGRRKRGRTHKRAISFVSNTPRRSGLVRGR